MLATLSAMVATAPVLFCSTGTPTDLVRALGRRVAVFASTEAAIRAAPEGSGLLVLADGYPERSTPFSEELRASARRKRLRTFVEFHGEGALTVARWERGIVVEDRFGPALPKMRLLALHNARYFPTKADRQWLAIGKVAGFDRAVFGPPEDASALLYERQPGELLVATTKISDFATSRFARPDDWKSVWGSILEWLSNGKAAPSLSLASTVRPAYGASARLPRSAETDALRLGTRWFERSRMLVDPSWANRYEEAGSWPDRIGPRPNAAWKPGNGSLGVLEGFDAHIDPTGHQPVRWWRRADCAGETAAALALSGRALANAKDRRVARNLCGFLMDRSVMSQGDRRDPKNAAGGLIGWNDVENYAGALDGYDVYYGDDNARAMLGVIAASGALRSPEWDKRLLEALYGNLRTTGSLGFRRDRIDGPELRERGWRAYFDEPITSYSPHYQAYLWACYLWAYRHTSDRLFLDRTETAIGMTMDYRAEQPGWTTSMDSRMLLPLAWLVRAQDTPEHRAWLRTVVDSLAAKQDASGAVPEELGLHVTDGFRPPRSNAEYGTMESPLIQENGDKATDLLYTANFALIGLREAAAAMDYPPTRQTEDRLARFVCRVQARSKTHPELDGAWFRAFDYGSWDYWASSADAGWGAWCVETGWMQSWLVSSLALRKMKTSVWDVSAGTRIGLGSYEVRRRFMGS